MDPLRAAWDTRNPRERIALGLGALVLALLLLYAFVWEPLRAEQKRLRQSLPLLRAQAAQFAADAAEARRLRSVAQAQPDRSSTRASLEALAERAGVRASIKSITEVSGGRVQVALDPLAYEALVRWFGELARGTGFAVETLQLRPGAAPGTVMVQTLVLKGAGAS